MIVILNSIYMIYFLICVSINSYLVHFGSLMSNLFSSTVDRVSRRELKKNVNYIAGELFTECLINSMFIPGTDKVKADELMAEVLKMQDEFVTRISHTEPGNVKGFYKKFRADFNAKVNEIIEAIGKLN